MNINTTGQHNQKKAARRNFIRYIGSLGFLLSSPAFAGDLFKLLDPNGKNKDIKKLKNILGGAGDILASSRDIDYDSEFTIGQSLALEGFQRFGLPSQPVRIQRYVNIVGKAVARNSARPDIPYYFVVVDSPLYNAFACPGGIIFISSTLVKNLKSESELAGVLAHEVGHVTHRHALGTIKRGKLFEGLGKISKATMKGKDSKKFHNIVGGLQNVLFDKGLDKNLEFEADITALQIAYNTGYNPQGFIRVLEMLHTKQQSDHKKGSWFSTHPPLNQRIDRCYQKLNEYTDAKGLEEGDKRFIEYKNMII